MENLEKVKKIANEIVEGDNKNLLEFRKLLKELFKSKTQKDFDKIDKRKLQGFLKFSENLSKNEELSEVDRAFVDFYFNDKPRKSFFFEISKEIDEATLKKLVREIHDSEAFGKKGNREFMSFIAETILVDDWWGDMTLESDKKDLYLDINFHNEMEEKPEVDFFIIGTWKFESLIEKLSKILK
jgi:hypothetical protein